MKRLRQRLAVLVPLALVFVILAATTAFASLPPRPPSVPGLP